MQIILPSSHVNNKNNGQRDQGFPVCPPMTYELCKYGQFWVMIHSNSWTSKETANFHFPHSSVEMSLTKPQIKSQRAHDHKNHQAYRGREAPSGALILPISRPGAEPLIFQLTDDKAAHESSGAAKVTLCLMEYGGTRTLRVFSLAIGFCGL